MQTVNSDNLAATLELVSRGDEAALGRLYRGMNRKIYAFALQFLRDAQLAEDVVTETMFDVWRLSSKFGGQSLVSTWILGIARHKALDKVRSRKSIERIETSWNDMCDLIPSDDPTAFEELARRQTAHEVQRCLAMLPIEQRECMHLVFYEDMGLAEIAALQGVPENTVKTRVFHARRKLRGKLEAGCAGEVRRGRVWRHRACGAEVT